MTARVDICLLDESALDLPKRAPNCVPRAGVVVDLTADVRFGTKRGVEDDAPPLRQTVHSLRDGVYDRVVLSRRQGSRVNWKGVEAVRLCEAYLPFRRRRATPRHDSNPLNGTWRSERRFAGDHHLPLPLADERIFNAR